MNDSLIHFNMLLCEVYNSRSVPPRNSRNIAIVGGLVACCLVEVLKRLPRENWHGFMQCVLQALSYKQLAIVLQMADDNNEVTFVIGQLWTKERIDWAQYCELHKHKKERMEVYLRAQLRLSEEECDCWKEGATRTHVAQWPAKHGGHGFAVRLFWPWNGAKL